MKNYAVGASIFIVAVIIWMLVFGFILMWLWNWLMPFLFGLPAINVFEAMGIYAISTILFGIKSYSKKS